MIERTWSDLQANALISNQPDEGTACGFGDLPSSGPLPPHLVVKKENGTLSTLALIVDMELK